jgi:hypothetical protein
LHGSSRYPWMMMVMRWIIWPALPCYVPYIYVQYNVEESLAEEESTSKSRVPRECSL